MKHSGEELRAKTFLKQQHEIWVWIEASTGHRLVSTDLGAALRDGVALLRLLDRITPGKTQRSKCVWQPKRATDKKANIKHFLTVCNISMKIPAERLFSVHDLFRGENMLAVVSGLHTLAAVARRKKCQPFLKEVALEDLLFPQPLIEATIAMLARIGTTPGGSSKAVERNEKGAALRGSAVRSEEIVTMEKATPAEKAAGESRPSVPPVNAGPGVAAPAPLLTVEVDDAYVDELLKDDVDGDGDDIDINLDDIQLSDEDLTKDRTPVSQAATSALPDRPVPPPVTKSAPAAAAISTPASVAGTAKPTSTAAVAATPSATTAPPPQLAIGANAAGTTDEMNISEDEGASAAARKSGKAQPPPASSQTAAAKGAKGASTFNLSDSDDGGAPAPKNTTVAKATFTLSSDEDDVKDKSRRPEAADKLVAITPTTSNANVASGAAGSDHRQETRVMLPEGAYIKYRAVYDFVTTERGQLSFKTGDILNVYNRDSADWFGAEFGGNTGYVPSNRLQEIPAVEENKGPKPKAASGTSKIAALQKQLAEQGFTGGAGGGASAPTSNVANAENVPPINDTPATQKSAPGENLLSSYTASRPAAPSSRRPPTRKR